jgi:hypothetical protein
MLTIRAPWGEETMYEIGGVAEDVPKKSRFKFDFLVHGQSLQPDEFWNVPDYPIYIVLNDNKGNDKLAKALSHRINQAPQLINTNRNVEISLTSLADVSLTAARTTIFNDLSHLSQRASNTHRVIRIYRFLETKREY